MARSFNGTTDTITVSNVALLRMTGAQSQACWINFASNTTRQDFFALWNTFSTQASWILIIISSGSGCTFRYFISTSGTNAFGVDSTIVPTVGTWYHVAGTWDGTNEKVYVNGVLKASAAPGGSMFAGNGGVTIASSNERDGSGPTPNYANAKMADCAEYNVALTAGEVLALANGARPYTVRPNALVAYWPLDGLASPEPDLTGNKNNGTLVGTPSLINGPPFTLWTPKAPAPSNTIIFPYLWGYQPWDESADIIAEQVVTAVEI